MQFYAKAVDVASRIVDQFAAGTVPDALANAFLIPDGIPCQKWSWCNRVLTILAGHFDARSFKEWQKVGRQVKKGEKAFWIFAPLCKRDVKDGEEIYRLFGFKAVPRFGLAQTDGDDVPTSAALRHLDSLPLRSLADKWGLSVECREAGHTLGSYNVDMLTGEGVAITLATRNLSTWAHELVHAAEHRLGKDLHRADPRAEIVAELGGATLLRVLGYEVEADLGGAYEYCKAWAKAEKAELRSICCGVLTDIGAAVSFILEEAATSPAEAVSVAS